MNKDSKIQAQHLLDGTPIEFTLVATKLKRQSEGEAERFYPWFSEDEAKFDNLSTIFGKEMLEEMAVDALQREFQLLYFQRSPSKELVPVLKDGKPATLPDGKPVMQKDLTPRLDQFLAYIKDENLSGREITPEYCMRKAMGITTGTDKKWKDKPEVARQMEAMKWMAKAQELMVAALNKK